MSDKTKRAGNVSSYEKATKKKKPTTPRAVAKDDVSHPNTDPVAAWMLPAGTDYLDLFGTKMLGLKGWPVLLDTRILKPMNKTQKAPMCARFQSTGKCQQKQFTFAKYLATHQTAHNELGDCNEPIPETKKVSDFLAGIADSSLEAGITCVLSEERYQDSFEATQPFLGTLVANQMIHHQAERGGGDERNVSSAEGGGKAETKSSKGNKKLEARFYSADESK